MQAGFIRWQKGAFSITIGQSLQAPASGKAQSSQRMHSNLFLICSIVFAFALSIFSGTGFCPGAAAGKFKRAAGQMYVSLVLLTAFSTFSTPYILFFKISQVLRYEIF
jgi:hypothetical protein